MAQHRQLLTGRQHTLLGLIQVGIVIHDLEFKVGGLADKLDGPFGILQARQLDLNAVVGLFADIGFGYAEFVDTVADGLDGLIHGHAGLIVAVALGEGQRVAHAAVRGGLHVVDLEHLEVLGQHVIKLLPLVRGGEDKLEMMAVGRGGGP